MVGTATKILLPEEAAVEVAEAVDLLARRTDLAKAGVFIVGANGEREFVELRAEALAALTSLLSTLAEAGAALLVVEEAEATPAEAAEILGISRPLVYQRMDDGRLQFRKVGSHRRVRVRDVLALQPSEERRKQAARELAEDTDEIEAGHPRPTAGAH